MILDQFGQPIGRENTFFTSDWLRREGEKLAQVWEAERRLSELRSSIAFAERADEDLVGTTIQVRLPKRFTQLATKPEPSE